MPVEQVRIKWDRMPFMVFFILVCVSCVSCVSCVCVFVRFVVVCAHTNTNGVTWHRFAVLLRRASSVNYEAAAFAFGTEICDANSPPELSFSSIAQSVGTDSDIAHVSWPDHCEYVLSLKLLFKLLCRMKNAKKKRPHKLAKRIGLFQEHTHTHAHAHAHTCTHTYTSTHTHTSTHTQAHIQAHR